MEQVKVDPDFQEYESRMYSFFRKLDMAGELESVLVLDENFFAYTSSENRFTHDRNTAYNLALAVYEMLMETDEIKVYAPFMTTDKIEGILNKKISNDDFNGVVTLLDALDLRYENGCLVRVNGILDPEKYH